MTIAVMMKLSLLKELLDIEREKWRDFPRYRIYFHGYEDFIGSTASGELNVFSGTTGGGKTTLLKSMSMDYASQGHQHSLVLLRND